MLTFTLGTFAIALNHLLLISALALATFVGWRVAKRGGENPESALFSLLLIGMLAARIGFVAVYWAHYRNDPWQVIDLRDTGIDHCLGVFRNRHRAIKNLGDKLLHQVLSALPEQRRCSLDRNRQRIIDHVGPVRDSLISSFFGPESIGSRQQSRTYFSANQEIESLLKPNLATG